MPKLSASVSVKLKNWIRDYSELRIDGNAVFCTSCEKTIGSERKSQIDAHCSTGMLN